MQAGHKGTLREQRATSQANKKKSHTLDLLEQRVTSLNGHAIRGFAPPQVGGCKVEIIRLDIWSVDPSRQVDLWASIVLWSAVHHAGTNHDCDSLPAIEVNRSHVRDNGGVQ